MPASLPTLLTWSRILMIPVLAAVYYSPIAYVGPITAGLFAITAVTDWLDGYLARKFNQTTEFGSFLDPVADKLMIAAVLVLLVQSYPTLWVTAPAIVIISREITISALREWMAQLGAGSSVAVSWLGKIKTAAQMASLTLLLMAKGQPDNGIFELGLALLYVAAALTVWSMSNYLWSARKVIKTSN